MFDPEKVERFDESEVYGKEIRADGYYVCASDYDQLLELYRKAQEEIEYLKDSSNPQYDTNQVG